MKLFLSFYSYIYIIEHLHLISIAYSVLPS